MTERDACGVGFLADLSGKPSHEVVRLGLAAVGAMAHRGARAADGKTGDGAGILCDAPRALFARHLEYMGVHAPVEQLAAVSVFLAREPARASAVRSAIEEAVHAAGLEPLCWRTPLTDTRVLGFHAARTEPHFLQLILDRGPGDGRAAMRRARRTIEDALRRTDTGAHVLSCSASSVAYKALVSSDELSEYFADLKDPLFESRFVIFHQRYSTNTGPSWRLVQPFRHVAHNGEINTIAGNRAWLIARGINVTAGCSDSHDLNIAVETLLDSGYSVDDAVDLLLGAAVDPGDERLKAYYEAHLPTIEHWDGPAALIFGDGDIVGAALDRSGFRPLRWCRTASGKVLAASETGVVDFGADPVVQRGRLGPGQRLVARLDSGELIDPERFHAERRERDDYRELVKSWAFDAVVARGREPDGQRPGGRRTDQGRPFQGDEARPLRQMDLRRFAYTREEEKDVVGVMASGAGEPVFSMGDDAALTFLVRRQPVANYLRQRFAQVTNPPIDSLRESLVFDMRAYVGHGRTHGEVPPAGAIISMDSPVVDELIFETLCSDPRVQPYTIPLILDARPLVDRLRAICDEAEFAVREGATLIVADDRLPGPPVPALLAAGAIHQRLTATGLRMQASIAVADGFARDAHSTATVLSAGANIVTPWLALRLARTMGSESAFLTAVRSGLMKIMAKLGVCTFRSYAGAQTFECLGLAQEIVSTCFPAMPAHLPALGFAELQDDIRAWHDDALTQDGPLPDRGLFRYRRDGVRRAFDPNVLKMLRASAMQGDYEAYERLSDAMEQREPVVARDLLEALPLGPKIPVEETQPLGEITARFTTAAMSHGALGREAHETVARAANRIGARSNSGEGGEDPSRYAREFGNARSAIKQVASGRFGVSVSYLESADELEIKMAQGSKPGEGGQIPGHKVSQEIAGLRGASPGQALISPPPHHDIYSIEDLAQLIYDLRRAAPHARIAVKLVAQAGIGQVACGVAKGGPDVIHISGHDGGTGASPLGSIKHSGLPWELGLVEAHHALTHNGLRPRVRLRVDGGMKSGRDVIMAALLGADEFGFGSALLVALGCIMARQCHKNTCPVGVATQDPELRKKFAGAPEHGVAFFEFVAKDVRRRLARMGARSLQEIRGRHDLLRARALKPGAYAQVDLSALLRGAPAPIVPTAPAPPAPPHLDDDVVVPWEEPNEADALRRGRPGPRRIRPEHRTVGARVAYKYALRRAAGASQPPIELRYQGSAGQSFGAFLTEGMTLHLEGDANDYVGKSMDGGRLVVVGLGDPRWPVIGNTCFYGARGGEAFVRGSAGERFGVRNSGASLVAEGAGDHACEYMTSGVTVILGRVGRNVASGMSGGLAFIYDETGEPLKMGPADVAATRCSADDPDASQLRVLLEKHLQATGSARAAQLLAAWPASAAKFWKLSRTAAVQAAPEPAAAAKSHSARIAGPAPAKA